MADIEKVIDALEICVNDSNICGKMCEKCQYESDYHRHCHEILMADALELLKEYKRQDGCPCPHCMEWECDEVCDEYKKWKNS